MKPLLLLILLLLVAACGAEQPDSAASPYQLVLSSADVTPSSNRMVLTIWDGPERLEGVEAMAVSLYTIDAEGAAASKVWEGPARSYTMGDVQYWVSYPQVPGADIYGVLARYQTADGKTMENQTVVQVKEDPEAPGIGEEAPHSQSRTLDDAPLEALSSAGPYVEAFYQMSVADAVQSGQPAVIAFVTPGYCTSALCGPVLESMAEAREALDPDIPMVHVEVYRDFERRELDPAMQEWNLPSEPWIFVVDRAGNVAARLDGPVSTEELLETVREVQGG